LRQVQTKYTNDKVKKISL